MTLPQLKVLHRRRPRVCDDWDDTQDEGVVLAQGQRERDRIVEDFVLDAVLGGGAEERGWNVKQRLQVYHYPPLEQERVHDGVGVFALLSHVIVEDRVHRRRNALDLGQFALGLDEVVLCNRHTVAR